MPHCPVTVVQRYRDGVCSLLFHSFFIICHPYIPQHPLSLLHQLQLQTMNFCSGKPPHKWISWSNIWENWQSLPADCRILSGRMAWIGSAKRYKTLSYSLWLVDSQHGLLVRGSRLSLFHLRSFSTSSTVVIRSHKVQGQSIWWPGLSKQLEDLIHNRERCQMSQGPATATTTPQPNTTSFPPLVASDLLSGHLSPCRTRACAPRLTNYSRTGYSPKEHLHSSRNSGDAHHR